MCEAVGKEGAQWLGCWICPGTGLGKAAVPAGFLSALPFSASQVAGKETRSSQTSVLKHHSGVAPPDVAASSGSRSQRGFCPRSELPGESHPQQSVPTDTHHLGCPVQHEFVPLGAATMCYKPWSTGESTETCWAWEISWGRNAAARSNCLQAVDWCNFCYAWVWGPCRLWVKPTSESWGQEQNFFPTDLSTPPCFLPCPQRLHQPMHTKKGQDHPVASLLGALLGVILIRVNEYF